jgi:hypothetical protein
VNYWDPKKLNENVYDSTKWIDKMENGPWKIKDVENRVGVADIKRYLLSGLPRNDLVICLLVENKGEIFLQRLILTRMMYDIEKKIMELYPEEIATRRKRSIEICKKEKDIINEKMR